MNVELDLRFDDGPIEGLCLGIRFDQHGLRLLYEIEPLPAPISARGRQGLWEWEAA